MGNQKKAAQFTQYFPLALLILLLLFYFIQRGGLLIYGVSHIFHPAFDETASGVLTCDLLDGNLRAPLFEYQYEHRSGDSLFESFMLVPIFMLFGRSLFSLKIFCMLWIFLALIMWCSFLKKYNGLWAAIIFAGLFAFPPVTFSRLNLVGTIASHHAIIPVMIAQLIILFKIFEYPAGEKIPLRLWACLGLLAGFGAFMFYTYIIFNVFCTAFLLVFRLSRLTLCRIFCFFGFFVIGFIPWITRLVYSKGGRDYLTGILLSGSTNIWNFVQSFFFTVPHSFGYNYPLRSIGPVSIAFWVLILLCICTILKYALVTWKSFLYGSTRSKIEHIPLALLQGIFVALFPVFLMACISLSSKQINPFEYWPGVGLFAAFKESDMYPYRWIHAAYPFYFAAIAVGVILFMRRPDRKKLLKAAAVGIVLFFIIYSSIKSFGLYAKNDRAKIFGYKAYNYERLANRLNRFNLESFNSDYTQSKTIALHYPDEIKPEAYRCLGMMAVFSLLYDPQKEKKFQSYLLEVPKNYMPDFIYGTVLAAQNITPKAFQPFMNFLAGKYPAIFFTNWGYRYLAQKYYGIFINYEMLLNHIPPAEKWYFKTFLNDFEKEFRGSDESFFNELYSMRESHYKDIVEGLGMLVGAEMLFDSLHTLDYPLDSTFGEKFTGPLQDAFYQGVGRGFAETLYRFWRRLLPPAHSNLVGYEEMLEVEWQRCQSLMVQVPAQHAALTKMGFAAELNARKVNPIKKNFITAKINCALQME